MPQVRMITGTARSGRAAYLDRLLLDRLDESLLVVPTAAYARRRAGGLLAAAQRTALLDPPVITFAELAARILRGSEHQATPISSLEQRIVLQRAVAHARVSGALDTLGAVSESEGFLDHLLSVIGQIKQAAIEPARFRQQIRARKHSMDAIVSEVYGRYQEELKRSGSVDLQGMYWLARIVCEGDAPPRALAHVQHLLFDDFDDFTPSEFEVIRALSAHTGELVFGLNLSDDPERKNLYALPLTTRNALRDAFPDAQSIPCDEQVASSTSEFIAASLLMRREATRPPGLREDIAFLECHTLEHEIETIARRIKHLVRTEGVALPDIAVVWRNTARIAAPMREIFREFGVPLTGLEGYTLAESAVAGFILRFLNAAQAWTVDTVLDVITSPWFAGAQASHRDVFPILVRAARVRPTRHGWHTSIDRLARHLDDPRSIELKRLLLHVPQAREACTALQESLAQFSTQCSAFARTRPAAAHADALLALCDQWLWADAIAALPEGEARTLEKTAVRELIHTLTLVRDLHAGDTTGVEPATLAQMLRRAFAASPVNVPACEGGVACLGMEPARYLSFDHVFLAGMTDEHVPAHRKLSAIYSDDECAALASVGIELDHAETHNQREILQFQRMFGIATRQLTVSWHRLAPGAKAVRRSLYMNEVADRLGGLNVERAVSSTEVFLPPAALAGSSRDAHNLAVSAGDPSTFPAIAATAAMEGARYGFGRLDAHDGALADARALAWIRAHYGDAHVFSASQLEAYADCPFRFFQERVLDLLNIESAELAFDHLARGLVLHEALHRFHERFAGRVIPGIPPDEADPAMMECAGAAFDQVALQFRHLPEGVLVAERARTTETLMRYVRIQRDPQNKKAPAPWPPEHFEMTFGQTAETSGPPFTLDTAAGAIRLSGRIDRIDRDGTAFRLIDYKSSPVKKRQIDEGKQFQLALYALAAEAVLLQDQQCADAMYVPVGHDKNPRIALSREGTATPPWELRIARAKEAVADAVSGIRAGRFHPTLDKNPCKGCAAQKICRFERARMRRKTLP